MYIYLSHMGGLYTSEEYLEYEDIYCETCGDCDTNIGYAETREKAIEILSNDSLSLLNWSDKDIQEFIDENWPKEKGNEEWKDRE